MFLVDVLFERFLDMVTTKSEMKKLLEAKFLGVHDSLFKRNRIGSLKFLLKMIDKYKIDCSDYYLGCVDNCNAFIPGRNVLSLRTDQIAGQVTTQEDSKFIIAHELRHIMQCQKGKLKIEDNNILWLNKGKFRKWNALDVKHLLRFDPRQYDCLPWETDADMFALTYGDVDVTKLVNKCVVRHYTYCKERFPDQVK